MKKMVLGLSLTLAALGFLVSPTLAAASPSPAAPVLSLSDQAFLASLGGTPAPEPAAKKPAAFILKATCTANCANGGTVSCTGGTCSAVNGSCPSEPGHVTCDGVTTACSACGGCGPDWCTEDCDADCPCGGTLLCNATLCTSHCHCKLGCPQ